MRKGNAHRLTLYVLPSFGGRHYIAVVDIRCVPYYQKTVRSISTIVITWYLKV